ncbi:MAG: 4Fe-4S binding protein [Bosea sp. (in: a-proteobacteria)]
MSVEGRTLVICSCEDTMPVDGAAVARACAGADVKTARHLCRSQVESFRALIETGKPLTIGCTQEAPLFREIAADMDHAGEITFANLRETGGWSKDASDKRQATNLSAKMAALLAAASEPMPPTPFVTLTSRGVILVYGRDEAAIEAGQRLADELDVTVILSKPGDIAPPRANDFPIVRGTITRATGHLGAFALNVDDMALARASSRRAMDWETPRNGATSQCDILLDLSGGKALFPADDLRAGYLRADPANKAAVETAIATARGLVGEFDKPRYVKLDEGLCAHSRSKKTGCTRCLDLCPTSAITPLGDHVSVSAEICAGCGACAAVCPTGAISYALPPADALMRRMRTLLTTYAQAGGQSPVLLIHEGEHGEALIDALARFGDGLPANVLPLRVNEVTQTGLEFAAAALSFGASAIRFLSRAKPKHDVASLDRTSDYANTLASALGYGEARIATIAVDDPDMLGAALRAIPAGTAIAEPARFMPMGSGRPLLKSAILELHKAAPAPVSVVPMPALSPFGGLDIKVDGCTLCLACVAACPVSALGDDKEKPTLTFQEDLCVQCGLCAATCPEKVITLEPKLDFAAWEAGRRIVKQEEPFHCINCAKPFGTKSTIDRIVSKLKDKHWMFSGEQAKRISVIQMCEDCRVEVVVNESFDPHASPQRPKPRTSEDYLREREERGDDPLN